MAMMESDFLGNPVLETSGFQYSLSPEPSVQIKAMLAFFTKAEVYSCVYFVFSQALKNSDSFGWAYLRSYTQKYRDSIQNIYF